MEPVGACSSKTGDFWRQMRGVPQTSITKHSTAKQGRLSSQICKSNVFTRCAALILTRGYGFHRGARRLGAMLISQEVHLPSARLLWGRQLR